MNISKIDTNISFRGYKNAVSYSIADDYKIFGFSYLALLLNNDDGKNDLDTWHDIQRKLFITNEPPSDYLILNLTKIDTEDMFILNGNPLRLDDIKSPQEERAILKAYTLLASLTKRISNTLHHPEDGKLYLTLVELVKDLSKIFIKPSDVQDLAMLGATKKVKHYKTADFINERITQKMTKYFKL